MHIRNPLAAPSVWACVASLVALGISPAQDFGDSRAVSFELDKYFVQDPAAQGDYSQLWQRLQATEARLQQLEQGGAGFPNPLERPPLPANGKPPDPSGQQCISAGVSTTRAAEKPRFPSARLTGFFHLDAAAISQDAINRATLGDIQDGVGFRRARLAGVGDVSEFTSYTIEMDFATAGRPSFLDVWGQQEQVPFFGHVRIGHFRQATSMTSLTPIRQLTFLERPLPFQALDPFRRVGIMAYDKSNDEMWSWAYGIYRTGAFDNAPLGDTRYATDIGDQGGFSSAARFTRLLYYDEPSEGRYLLHVGGHYNYSRMTASTDNPVPFYQAQAIPEFFLGDPAGGNITSNGVPPFVNTGRLAADHFHYFGLQLAGQYGSAYAQAEYLATSVNQIGNPQVYYDGAYVHGGYFLTGENRTYNRMFGVFDRIIPYTDFFGCGRHGGFCGWGAWEVAGRWSYINLNDPKAVPIAFAAGPPPSPDPGRLHNSTLGLNWYWNPYAKMQFDWIHAFLDNAATGHSNADFFAGRFQVEF